MTDDIAQSDRRLAETVIAGGYCVGCGACAGAGSGRFAIRESLDGALEAVPTPSCRSAVGAGIDFLSVCPHSGEGPDEDELSQSLFQTAAGFDPAIGRYDRLYALAVRDAADRERGSSGGGVTWLLRELLRRDLVDAVAHVRPVDPDRQPQGMLFDYGLSRDEAALEAGRKSVYHPVSMDRVLDDIRATPGRYAVVAVPCFAAALRRLMRQDRLLRQRIRFVVGLVCGHMKTRYYGEYLAWMAGVGPGDLRGIDFRRKLAGRGASAYAIAARSADRTVVSLPLDAYFGVSWDLGFMKVRACDYCDDVFAETADITFGDAWVPPYDRDWLGHNVVVCRNPTLTALIEQQAREGVIAVDPLDVATVRSTQDAGLRHRRDGTRHRLARRDAEGVWRPRRRVEAGLAPTAAERFTFDMRERLAALSKTAFRLARRLNSLALFGLLMALPVAYYETRRHGLRRAVRQSPPFKWLRRRLGRAARF